LAAIEISFGCKHKQIDLTSLRMNSRMKKHKLGEPPPSQAACLRTLMALSTLMATKTRSQRAAEKEDHVGDAEDSGEVEQDFSHDKDSSSGSMRARQP
jgi:hypothetical protein